MLHALRARVAVRALLTLASASLFHLACTSDSTSVNRSPDVEITTPSRGQSFAEGATVTFEGTADDPEDGALGGGSLVWTSSVDGQIGTGATFTRADLSLGTHVLTLTATDGDGASAKATREIVVNALPAVTIESLADGQAFGEGRDILFRGGATDPEDGPLSGGTLVWSSDADGDFGTGRRFTAATLSRGDHTVTLTATDTDGTSASASRSIVVSGVPVVTLTSPVQAATYGEGEDVVMQGTATDPEDGALTGADLVWTSSLDGQLGTGTSVTRSDLSNGTHTITLTATDAHDIATSASVDILVSDCNLAAPDSDGDRLPDCAETNTGTYNSELDTGTDPADPDTDDDGIEDGDEVLGTTAGLDLPAMGVSPLQQDILLEYDWFDDANDCAQHSHQPTAAQVDAVTSAFAAAPVSNPDGTTGINVIHDYGQGSGFTGGNLVSDADGEIQGGVFNSEYVNYKAANFPSNRNGYFHYVLLPHRYGDSSNNSSGQASINGDDMIVSLQCAVGSTVAVANTIVHELGHNLNLRHGGNVNLPNYKPNYNSVMNYKYQFPGIDNDCTPPGNDVLSFSVGDRPALDENNLSEPDGVCGAGAGPGWDWNGDTDTDDTALALDINVDGDGIGDGFLNVLQDYDDWANIVLTGIGGAPYGAPAVLEVVDCQETPQLPPG